MPKQVCTYSLFEYCKVNFSGFLRFAPNYHLVVWDDGRAAGEALFHTPVADTILIDAFERLGARAGNGWGLTGDVGFCDAEGFLTLVDRAKDMLISGGENVYPKEIEDVIYSLEEVSECAVFGIPDEKWGEVPAAFIQLRAGCALTEAQVVRRCEERLARLKRPRLVRFVDGFPKTPIGKIQKNLLKEPFWVDRKKI